MKNTPESRSLCRELYKLYTEGKTDAELMRLMQERGQPMTRSAIMRARNRGQDIEVEIAAEVAAQQIKVEQPKPQAPVVETTDDQILSVIIRDLTNGYQSAKRSGKDSLRIDFARAIGYLAGARAKLNTAGVAIGPSTIKQYTVLASPDDWPDPPTRNQPANQPN